MLEDPGAVMIKLGKLQMEHGASQSSRKKIDKEGRAEEGEECQRDSTCGENHLR